MLTKNRVSDLLYKLEEEATLKRDQLVDFSKLRFNDDGSLSELNGNLQNYKLTDWAASQLCTKIGMPYNYFERCPEELRSMNVNHWLEGASSKEVLLRLRENEDANTIRSIASSRYTKFDNHEVVALVDQFLNKLNKDYEIEMWRNDGDNFHLRMTFDHMATDVGKTPFGQDDIHKVGVHIMNSEVGKSSVRIMPMVYRLVCTNGLMAWRASDDIFSQRHIYINENEMEERVAVAFANALQLGNETIEVLRQSKQVKVSNPLELIDKLAKSEKYSKKFVETVKLAYGKENDGSLFYVVQSLTAAAKELDNDRRIEVEHHASKLLTEAKIA